MKPKKSLINIPISDFDGKGLKKIKRWNVKRLRYLKHTGKSKEYAYERFPKTFVDQNW